MLAILFFAILLICFFNEYKTKNLVKEFFGTDSLVGETYDITIINHDNSIVNNDFNSITTAIRKDSPLYPAFINSLEKIIVKRTNNKFPYREGYSFIIYHNSALNIIRLNKNGLLNFKEKTYEIQNTEAFEDLIEIIKESTD